MSKYRAHTGNYKVQNPSKYKMPKDGFMGSSVLTEHCLVLKYKSGLEFKAFKYCDLNPYILEWSLEPFSIQYLKPSDNKFHRYYPDLWVKTEDKTFLIEIKAFSETHPPKRKTKKAVQTWAVNSAKWNKAKEFCELNSLEFLILTEKDLKF